MPAESWITTENDRKLMRIGIEMQATYIFNTDDFTIIEGLSEFIDSQVEVLAAFNAQTRWLNSFINKDLNTEAVL